MTNHRIDFDDADLQQFSPQVREALTRLAMQQKPPDRRAPSQPGGFTVVHRETQDEIEAKLKDAEGRGVHLVDRLSPYHNPVLPKEQ